MTTWEEFKRESLKDPDIKREYDALEGWYQEELARQEALDRKEEEHHRTSTPPPRPAFA